MGIIPKIPVIVHVVNDDTGITKRYGGDTKYMNPARNGRNAKTKPISLMVVDAKC